METRGSRQNLTREYTKKVFDSLKEHQIFDTLTITEIDDASLNLAVEISLDKGIDLNSKSKKYETILVLAILKRAKGVIDFLLTSEVGFYHSVTLHLIEDERKKFLELQNQSEISENEANRVETESANYVEWLISKGLDFDFRNEKGQSALCMAIEYNLQHILPVLLTSTKDIKYVDYTKKTLLHLFCKNNVETNRRGINKNWYSKRYASNILQILLNRGVSPDAEDQNKGTPSRLAILNNQDIEIIEMLLERSTNVNRKYFEGETMFHTVIRKWANGLSNTDYYTRIARALIAKGADVNESKRYGTIPLALAITERRLCIVEFLQENGADFSVTTDNNKTLLHLLLANNHAKNTSNQDEIEIGIFNIIITNGGQMEAKDKYGLTPLHLAAHYGYMALVQKLLEHGVNINCRNNKMETPLIYLAKHSRRFDIAKLLLESGANVNAKDFEGSTALHATVNNMFTWLTKYWRDGYYDCDDHQMLQLLLKHGADFNATFTYLCNSFNRNPTIFASKSVAFLLEHRMKFDFADLNFKIDNKRKNCIENEKYENYYKTCSKEIEKLKSTLVDNNATLYSFLYTNPNRRRAYINGKELQKLLHSADLEEQFPEYSILIWASYHEAVARKSILEPAKEAWRELTEISLPEICIEHIFSFLSNLDLLDMIGNN